ncbi:NblA/ycf18 family protein [Lyngbya sp. CCY1209]|uniref:NblA/ycf18 family protein n=1 Tax=Lyngbya sp. CCY1209 TaxID=2886103 RepID=UPI002D2163B9|nr:NblA/ycf18 family protein [Lyngbya sp. CCY1209]MEB3885462.1 NblA/ycf18 family protein [Lyngbya sp. CCY1209]
MESNGNLSLEQQFNLSSFKMQVNQMSREQAQEFLVNLYEQMLIRENMYQHFLKYQWGLESSPGTE